MLIFRLLFLAPLLLGPLAITAKASEEPPATEIQVAVASNFAHCFTALAKDFTDQTGIKVLVSPGSTGRHFAQIKAGAPFHVFLAADALRPKLLEDDGLIKPGSRFTYAVGRLVFWSPASEMALSGNEATLTQMLTQPKIKHLAMANPRLAPYGKAARQVLEHLGLDASLVKKIVTGQNISQTWQFVASGNAGAGLVALSQVMTTDPDSWYLIPRSMHDPIIQQCVLLQNRGSHIQRKAAAQLLQYLQSPDAKEIMATFGYEHYDEIKP